ncbi:hypothetical protein RAS2_28520 [Phycisphaerae bacterium RAS2]|nr:hypothetical protein RAS2_28520 [Phycisphaerae bacterium RAS2]
MSGKQPRAEEKVDKLIEADVLIKPGRTVVDAWMQIGVSEQTYYRWRKEYSDVRHRIGGQFS